MCSNDLEGLKKEFNPAFFYACVFIDVHHPCTEEACMIRKNTLMLRKYDDVILDFHPKI